MSSFCLSNAMLRTFKCRVSDFLWTPNLSIPVSLSIQNMLFSTKCSLPTQWNTFSDKKEWCMLQLDQPQEHNGKWNKKTESNTADYIFPLIRKVWKRQISRDRGRPVAAQGRGERGNWLGGGKRKLSEGWKCSRTELRWWLHSSLNLSAVTLRARVYAK